MRRHQSRFASALFRRAFFAALVLAFIPGQGPPVEAQALEEGDPVVVYLVRHAEKADEDSADPPLALAGQIRVQTLRALLGDVGITHVHSTDLMRTRDTARPLAEDAGVEVALYDPRDLAGFAAQLAATPGRHLVAGHSNTTPDLVAALGGDPKGTIHELEYDRLYIVTILPGQPPVTSMLRYGEPYVAGQDFGLRRPPNPATHRPPPIGPPSSHW